MAQNYRNQDYRDQDGGNRNPSGRWREGREDFGRSDFSNDDQRGDYYRAGGEQDLYERGREKRDYSYAQGGRSRGNELSPNQGVSQGGDYQRRDFQGREYGQEYGGRSQGYQGGGQGNYGGTPTHDDWGYVEASRDPWRNRNWNQGSGTGMYGSDQNFRGSDYSGSQQSHRGRGPKGYTRSDERLKELICERLTDDPNIDASEVTIEVAGQSVKLTGTIDDRRAKYEIEEMVERIGGVKDIDNQLRVQSSQSRGGAEGSSNSASFSGGKSTDNKSSATSGTGSTTKHN